MTLLSGFSRPDAAHCRAFVFVLFTPAPPHPSLSFYKATGIESTLKHFANLAAFYERFHALPQLQECVCASRACVRACLRAAVRRFTYRPAVLMPNVAALPPSLPACLPACLPVFASLRFVSSRGAACTWWMNA